MNTAHVMPVNDDIAHERSDVCICGPEIEPVEREDGSICWLVIHSSLDGREQAE